VSGRHKTRRAARRTKPRGGTWTCFGAVARRFGFGVYLADGGLLSLRGASEAHVLVTYTGLLLDRQRRGAHGEEGEAMTVVHLSLPEEVAESATVDDVEAR
jgi:hypothetical protein